MKKIKKLIALTAVMTLFASQVQSQDYAQDAQGQELDESSAAYSDSGSASYLSAALPIGALAVAAIIIATTNRNNHSSSSSSSSFVHSH